MNVKCFTYWGIGSNFPEEKMEATQREIRMIAFAQWKRFGFSLRINSVFRPRVPTKHFKIRYTGLNVREHTIS
jgi:hypothetical protein